MDLSSVLKKQLEQKKLQRENANESSINEKSLKDLNKDFEEKSTDNQASNGLNVSDISEENRLLQSIDQEKLAESLRLFDETEESKDGFLKQQQLQKLQIHVKHEKKDARYKAYLDKENNVPVQIDVKDIAAQNSDKLCLQIRRFFKEILQTWSTTLSNDFPESILMETKRDIVKLMYKLRSGKLPPETVVSLSTIVYYIQTENVVKANESYLKLSIGNVAWPIGVRDVGMHARAASARIAGNDKARLANIMKSEATRRWLIAVKRIVNFCASLYEKQAQAWKTA